MLDLPIYQLWQRISKDKNHEVYILNLNLHAYKKLQNLHIQKKFAYYKRCF